MASSSRTWVLVVALVVVVAAGGALTFTALHDDDPYPGPWKRVAADVAVSEDRSTILVKARPYHSASCYEHRVQVAKGPRQWRVRLEVRRTGEWCTLEGCIGGLDSRLACGIDEQPVDGGVPEGVEVVPA